MAARPKKTTVENRHLILNIDPNDVSFKVTEKQTGTTWKMAPSSNQDVVIHTSRNEYVNRSFASSADLTVLPAPHGREGLRIRMRDLGLAINIILSGREVVCEVERLFGGGPAKVRDVLWPRHFLLPKRSDAYTVWTVGMGSIVPANTKARFHHPEGYSEQEQCWQGSVIGKSGMMVTAETPFDMYIAMSHKEREAPCSFIHWLPSLGDLRYTRRAVMHFAKGLDFIKMAKRYREHMKAEGHFVSLADKAKWNPNVKKLPGAAVVNSMTCIRRKRTLEYINNTFADQAKWMAGLKKRTGLKHAIMHVDGWGRYGYDSVHPETLPPNIEAGGAGELKKFRDKARKQDWLFGLHDQYIDIFSDAPSYDPKRFRVNEDGRPYILNMWAGGKCSHLCFSEALKFVRRNFVEGVKDQYMYHNSASVYDICQPDAYYLDCFCRIHECFNPEHPLPRTEVANTTNEILRTVREHGKKVVLSCEHPKFYAVQDLDFGWGIGHLNADVHVVGGGHQTQCIGIPVPLWNLEFHDALWLPLYGAGSLHNMLYGQAPYYQNTPEGPTDAEVAVKRKICALNKVVGFDEMTDFRIIDAAAGVFESEFSSGVQVRVDHTADTYQIKGLKSVATKGMVKL
ncbi:DUF5696 domain-containing protein [Planctomycetota bacterium]